VQFQDGPGDPGIGHRDSGGGKVADFRARGLDPGGLKGVDDLVELIDFTAHLVAIGAGDDVIGPGLQGDFHQAVLGGLVQRDQKLAGVQKLEGDGSVLGQVPAAAAEGGPHFLGGAGLVVGRDLDDEGDAARPVALVGHLLKYHAGQIAGAFLDGPLDVIHRHVGVAGLEQDGAQTGVGFGVAPAGLCRQRDIAGEAGEYFATPGIGDALGALDRGPLAMS